MFWGKDREVAERHGFRRLLVRILLLGLLFELSLWAGGLVAPLFEGWAPRQPVPSTNALLVEWRQSQYRQEADPILGDSAPPLALRTPAGATLDAAALRGKKVVLLFTQGDGG